ncbi:MAG: N-acetyl-gamma-glutamyl-phosphate reductase, partial [Spirochaetota bacterium]
MRRAKKEKIKAGIIGGAGYGGSELIKLLIFHPQVSLEFVTSRRYAGTRVSSINRHLSQVCDLWFVNPDVEKLPSDTDIV